jgi:hypothetical protein
MTKVGEKIYWISLDKKGEKKIINIILITLVTWIQVSILDYFPLFTQVISKYLIIPYLLIIIIGLVGVLLKMIHASVKIIFLFLFLLIFVSFGFLSLFMKIVFKNIFLLHLIIILFLISLLYNIILLKNSFKLLLITPLPKNIIDNLMRNILQLVNFNSNNYYIEKNKKTNYFFLSKKSGIKTINLIYSYSEIDKSFQIAIAPNKIFGLFKFRLINAIKKNITILISNNQMTTKLRTYI